MAVQLITPNPNIPYYGGLCEGFVEGTVGQASAPFKDRDGNYTTTGVYPTATAAWEANIGNHPDELPPKGMRTAIYFSLGSTKAGHVALALEDGRVASSTQPGYHLTAYIHPSLQDMINIYARYNSGCTYLGWSEYIGKLQIIEGGNMEDISTLKTEIDRLWTALNLSDQDRDKLWEALDNSNKNADVLKRAVGDLAKNVGQPINLDDWEIQLIRKESK